MFENVQQYNHCYASTGSTSGEAGRVLGFMGLGMQQWEETGCAADARTAAKRSTGLLLLRNSWRTVTAGVSSLHRRAWPV